MSDMHEAFEVYWKPAQDCQRAELFRQLAESVFLDAWQHQQAKIDALRAAALDCANDLEAELKDRHGCGNDEMHPSMQRRFDRDMEPVLRVRALTPQPEPTNEK